jgi:plasmid replication initiation protein
MDSTPDTMSAPIQIEDVQDGRSGSWIESQIDDATYDVVMALASKLEAIDTYRTYAQDGNAGLWEELARDERRHADRLVLQLRRQLA